MEPGPSLSVGDDDPPQARQTSVTAPPLLRVSESDLLSFQRGKHLFPLYHRWPTKHVISAALHLTARFLRLTRGLKQIS